MCHLALEKLLKAHVAEAIQAEPARTHSLMYLVRKAGLEVPSELLDFVGKISNASVHTRYPDDFSKLLGDYPRHVTELYMKSTEEVFRWLKEHPNLKE